MVLLFYELYKVELLTFFINWENWSVETRDFDFPVCKFYYLLDYTFYKPGCEFDENILF